MRLPFLLLVATVLTGCSVDPGALFKPHGEAATFTPTSAPRYERVGPLPDTMEGIETALKTPGTGCFATGEGEASSVDAGTVYLAAQEPLEVVSMVPGEDPVTVNRKTVGMTVVVSRSQVEIGRLAYAKPQ